jgi:hypothetical protein
LLADAFVDTKVDTKVSDAEEHSATPEGV